MNASSPHANCDIAIYYGIYGSDMIVHLLGNDMGQGNDVAITLLSEMSVFVSILMSNSDIMSNGWRS